MICSANQLTGSYMMATLSFNELIFAKNMTTSYKNTVFVVRYFRKYMSKTGCCTTIEISQGTFLWILAIQQNFHIIESIRFVSFNSNRWWLLLH